MLPALIERLAPAGVEVEMASTYDEAKCTICGRPPSAVIVNLGPADLPWHELHECCRTQSPPIPVLYESCIYHSPDEVGIGCLTKPYSVAELRIQLERLLKQASEPH
jgi:DNA-binding response OmpR family regulator